jgi:ribonucleoside-diphosphate reductase alpha chain
MYVIKRNGKKEKVNVEKIISRIDKQCYNLDTKWIIPFEVAQKVFEGVYDGVTSRQLDELAAETAAALTTKHPDYSILAARLSITSHHKDTKKSFYDTVKDLYKKKIVSKELMDTTEKYAEDIEAAIVHSRDFMYDYFGFKTLMRSYLLKINGKIVERPQHMIMRVALGIQDNDIKKAIEMYNLISEGYYTHATPTLFNAGTNMPQMSSCFLLQMQDDSIDGIFNTLKQVAKISKTAGGIGVAISNVRSKGSLIRGTNGESDGIVPMLKVFNETGRYVNQSGKRKGSIAVYLEPWHADIMDFLDLKKNTGKDEVRTRDLFLAMWMNDLFMQRLEKNEIWSLMNPDDCKGLQEAYGDDFEKLYTSYESEGKFVRQLPARDVWNAILQSQTETGVPYLAYKDAANEKSNQKNLGTLKTSNLCVNWDTLLDVRILKPNNTYLYTKLTIEEITVLFKEEKIIEVKSLNLKNSKVEYKTILAAELTNPEAELLEITDESTGKTIQCTPDHQIYTKNRGYVLAKDLKASDDLYIDSVSL